MEPDSTFYQQLLENMTEGVYFVDLDRRITYWNGAAETISGFSKDEVVGRRCFENMLRHVDEAGKDLCTDGCPLAATIADGKEREVDVFLFNQSGYRVPVRVNAAPIRDASGAITGAVERFIDSSERIAALERIEELRDLAYLDPLTRIGNRRFAENALTTHMDEFNRYGWSFAVMIADIDHFKRINDEHGHPVGDQMLQVVARTLAGVSRTHDFVGRWGGEEFLIVAVSATDESLRAVAERARSLVEASGLRMGNETIGVTVSIGAASVRPGDTVDTLVERADERLYRSKSEGRNRVTFK